MPRSDARASPGIFISYRRSDTPDAVGRIYDRLVSEFGKARVFKDVDSIPLGQDFRGHLNDIVSGCAAVLAIIGPRWTDARNEAGQRRLEDPDDFVRIELEAALTRNVPVVPVMVGHAPIPGTSQLPASLGSLAFRQSIEVRPDPDFHNDATRLVAALRAIIDPNAPAAPAPGSSGKTSLARRWLWPAFVAVTLAAIALAIPALRHLRETPPTESRIAINLPVVEGVAGPFALSPDGRQIVYMASGDGEFRLWLRSLSATTAQPLPGTGRAASPFWSPDGRSIGFFVAGSLKRLDIGGAQPQTLAALNGGTNGVNGFWSKNGDIVFNAGPGQPILRIAATGGPITEVVKAGIGDMLQIPLVALPDGQHFLFVTLGGSSDGIHIGTFDGLAPVRLTKDIGPAAYLSSGWLIWLPANGRLAKPVPLLAQRLDVRNGRLEGSPDSLASEVSYFSAAANGQIAYMTVRPAEMRRLTWVHRSGAELGTVGEADGTISAPRVAPDGRRVVAARQTAEEGDIWLMDGVRASRVTFDAARELYPVWSPDGTRIAYASSTANGDSLRQKLASGAGPDESLLAAEDTVYPLGWSSDRRYLLYLHGTAATLGDIWVLPMTGDRKPFVFLGTQFDESRGQFSPDGRWVAYRSNESGTNEVYVRPFVEADASGNTGSGAGEIRWPVSTAGGTDPVWRADGKEIYYINPAGDMMAAPITVTGSEVVPGAPVRLFASRAYGGGITPSLGRQYDVARDGRFLINRMVEGGSSSTITILQNWNPDAGK